MYTYLKNVKGKEFVLVLNMTIFPPNWTYSFVTYFLK